MSKSLRLAAAPLGFARMLQVIVATVFVVTVVVVEVVADMAWLLVLML